MKKYYEAYDDRYRQVHREGLLWFDKSATHLVRDTIEKYHIGKNDSILEIGTGEGRDAFPLLCEGYNLYASDISKEAVSFCQRVMPEAQERFFVLDAIDGTHERKYAFIYAVAVLHMLVEDGDRVRFLRFIREHLCDGGIALITTMGDGETERATNPEDAFNLQKRVHEKSGRMLEIASTTCRMVTFATLHRELDEAELLLLEEGVSERVEGFHAMMYTIVKGK
ncbi:MAG: class I SAM-dependent methyltransferase [Clostridia bacterium]|nr:class I SAM-dependent methyltransferase [Clostridia bacterium]